MVFLELCKKELKQSRIRITVFGILLLLIQLFLLQRYFAWQNLFIGLLSVCYIALFPVLMIVLPYQSLQEEWKNKTFFLLGSFPIRFSTVVFAKMAALLLEVLLYMLLTGISFFYLFNHFKAAIMPPAYGGTSPAALLAAQISFLAASYLVFLFTAGALTSWSLLMGRAAARLGWLLSMGMFFAGGWLVLRITPLLAPLFNWLPRVTVVFQNPGAVAAHYYLEYIRPGPLLPILLVGAGLVVLAATIFESYLE